MSLGLAILLVVAASDPADVLCVGSLEIVGYGPDAVKTGTEATRATLDEEGVTARFEDVDECPSPSLGVLHIQVVRAGNSVHLTMRAFGPNGAGEVTKIETQRPRASETLDLTRELVEIVANLRAYRAIMAPPPPPPPSPDPAISTAPAVPAFVQRIGVAPLALWTGGTISLIVAGGFELNALGHQRDLDGRDYDEHRRAGIRSQNIARVTGITGIVAIAAGVVLYVMRDDPGLGAGGSAAGGVEETHGDPAYQ